ncbi:hypothetical protein P7K49_034584 [Saguinus oedipus]|uniref:Exocyst complex component 3-like protein n=1 Tax=Saguinus oedipus TaxID=9490 RepID=A0ABQ9TV65_SAGOE|nr:hypothetical protein P7K49_034584 [Saguinus oedipus]
MPILKNLGVSDPKVPRAGTLPLRSSRNPFEEVSGMEEEEAGELGSLPNGASCRRRATLEKLAGLSPFRLGWVPGRRAGSPGDAQPRSFLGRVLVPGLRRSSADFGLLARLQGTRAHGDEEAAGEAARRLAFLRLGRGSKPQRASLAERVVPAGEADPEPPPKIPEPPKMKEPLSALVVSGFIFNPIPAATCDSNLQFTRLTLPSHLTLTLNSHIPTPTFTPFSPSSSLSQSPSSFTAIPNPAFISAPGACTLLLALRPELLQGWGPQEPFLSSDALQVLAGGYFGRSSQGTGRAMEGAPLPSPPRPASPTSPTPSLTSRLPRFPAVLEILSLIQQRELARADEHILELEAEELASSEGGAPGPRKAEGAGGGRRARDVALLYEALQRELWALVRETLAGPGPGAGAGAGAVAQLGQVLVQEEAADGRRGPEAARKLRARWAEAVARAARERLEAAAPGAPGGLAGQLEALRARLLEDMAVVRGRLAPAYPAGLGAFSVYLRGYHGALAEWLGASARRRLPLADRYALLHWHNQSSAPLTVTVLESHCYPGSRFQHLSTMDPPSLGRVRHHCGSRTSALCQHLHSGSSHCPPFQSRNLSTVDSSSPRTEVLGLVDIAALENGELGPLLSPGTLRCLEDECVTDVKAQTRAALLRVLQEDEEHWGSLEDQPSSLAQDVCEVGGGRRSWDGLDDAGMGKWDLAPFSPLLIPWTSQLLEEHTERAPRISQEFGERMAHCCLGGLAEFLQSFQQRVERFHENPAVRELLPDTYISKTIALVNCGPPLRALAERLARVGPPESEPAREASASALDHVTRLCHRVLADLLFQELQGLGAKAGE